MGEPKVEAPPEEPKEAKVKKPSPAERVQVAEDFVADLTVKAKSLVFPNRGCRLSWNAAKATKKAAELKDRYDAWKDKQLGKKSVKRKVANVLKLREKLAALEAELGDAAPPVECGAEAPAEQPAETAPAEAPPVVAVPE